MDAQTSQKYVELLRRELIPALGCTEPIAIAYAAALAVKALGRFPDSLVAACSGNIIKNVKGVMVPNSGGQKGIEAAAALGAVGGDPERRLEVLAGISPEQVAKAAELAVTDFCRVEILHGVENLHIIVTASAGKDSARAEIAGSHTNVVSLTRNGEPVLPDTAPVSPNSAPASTDSAPPAAATATARNQPVHGDAQQSPLSSPDFMTLAGIVEFAETCSLETVRDILERQIECNTRISREGLAHAYGACVGQALLRHFPDDVKTRARARAAAGSDARMGGCDLPVIINSGSGNQGLTVSLPVIEYAESLGIAKDALLRALIISNLTAVHIKTGMGKLSAFCGAVSAACGCGAGITHLHGGDVSRIEATVTNTLANVAGIVCDGAKASCAAKIASAVEAAIMGHTLSMAGYEFSPGDGLVKGDAEATIESAQRLAREGMKHTDEVILNIMIDRE